MQDLISRQAAIDALARTAREKFNLSDEFNHYLAGLMDGETAIRQLPSVQPEVLACGEWELSAQPEIPPYVAEIEAEYKKWVNIPYIRKPLAKALYEVWKKHDREDAERRTDG